MSTLLELAPGWSIDVERGPDWLIVTLHDSEEHSWEAPALAERLWALLEQHFTYRLVLDLSKVPLLNSSLLGQLVMLHGRISRHNGLLRLCGLSAQHQQTLRMSRLDHALPAYENCYAAVQGNRPMKPR